jgi:hypothetical protein
MKLFIVMIAGLLALAVPAVPASADNTQSEGTIVRLIALSQPEVRLPMSKWILKVQATCENGYGSCGQWNPDYGTECPNTERPCFHSDGTTTCEPFPECK